MSEDATLVGAPEPAPAQEFKHSPFRMLESIEGDTVFEHKHYRDDKVFKYEVDALDEDGVLCKVWLERNLQEVAEELSAATGEEYFVTEHTFTNECPKCVDTVAKSGFKGN